MPPGVLTLLTCACARADLYVLRRAVGVYQQIVSRFTAQTTDYQELLSVFAEGLFTEMDFRCATSRCSPTGLHAAHLLAYLLVCALLTCKPTPACAHLLVCLPASLPVCLLTCPLPTCSCAHV